MSEFRIILQESAEKFKFDKSLTKSYKSLTNMVTCDILPR